MKKYSLKIVQDSAPDSPREWDNLTTIFCFHKRYNLGDKHDYKSDMFGGWEEFKEHIIAEYKPRMIKPLYMYDHSGITISTSAFGCQFDSGQVGWVFITDERIKTLCGDMEMDNDRLDRIIEGEVETYDQYIQGEVYGYQIIETEICDKCHTHEEVVDSCYGYFGEENAQEAGNEALCGYEEKVLQTT